MRHKPSLALAVATLAACGGRDASGDGSADAQLGLQVGSSPDGFVRLDDGAPIAVYQGPQGGFHVYLGLRASGVAPGSSSEPPSPCSASGSYQNPCVDFEVMDLDAARVVDAFAPLRVALQPAAAEIGAFDLLPPRLVPLDIRSFDEIAGHHLRVTASLADRRGVRVEQSVTAISTPAR